VSRERSRHTIRRDGRSWQSRVWARIARDGMLRSRWPHGSASFIVGARSENMSDEAHREPAVPLERPERLRPSWFRRFARLGVLVCVCVAILGQRSDRALVDRRSACATAAHDRRPDAVQVCKLEFQRTQAPMIGVLWAEALYESGDRDAAKQVATRLSETSARPDALYILGCIAKDEDWNDGAIVALEKARMLHRFELNPWQLVRDDGVLAMIRIERNEFAEALLLSDECINVAQAIANTSLQSYCYFNAAKALIRVGYWSAAERELDKAKETASDDARNDLEYQQGNFAQESEHHDTAISMFWKALQHHKNSQDTGWIINTELNLAYSLAERKRLDEAQYYLSEATRLDFDHKKEKERTWVTAQIAYRHNDLTRAASLVEQYFEQLGPDDSANQDNQIDVGTLGAKIELERGNLVVAEQRAQRGINQVERIRGMQSPLELRPWVLGKRRPPYELLFTALARGERFEEAAMVFDEWQGRTVQDALARPQLPTSPDYHGMADQVTRLGDWLSMASRAPLAGSQDRQAVLRTMHDIDLLALIVANGDVWRLTANHGPPRLTKLGAFEEINCAIGEFLGHPTDVKLASVLGDLLLPDDVFRETNEVLHVIVDGRLNGLPVAALRRGITPLISKRPIVRLLRLPVTRCVDVARSGHATVLAVSDKELPNAQMEAEQVAELLRTSKSLHVTSEIGATATRDALLAARNDAVLHVAAHGKLGIDGASLLLADGEMSALEISAQRVAPSLAVLSACDGATSADFELAGSLAAGFLGAGSKHVVTTLRSVFDADALEISAGFYRNDGLIDPARALAAAQRALMKTKNEDWPLWVVFGPDVCAESALEQR
jgi:tetratricopeptide (TPR) repeat protein